MTPTEKGRRFDALYHGESNRSLATMVVNRESDLEELKAENASLRGAAQGLGELCDKYKTENAKLRELAERAWKSAERLCQAFDGPCRDDGVTIDKPCPMGERDEECVYGQLQRDMRDLGVEVDG